MTLNLYSTLGSPYARVRSYIRKGEVMRISANDSANASSTAAPAARLG
jgi:hypothetical protein